MGANDQVRIGHIGVDRRGIANLRRFLSHTVAVCDVDKRHAEIAQKLVLDRNGKCDLYADFRRMLDRKDIDAVVISTPDHWHALPAVLACEAGKDVYVEKPMTLTIAEGRAMVEAARKNHRIVQTGSQQRSMVNFRYACELVRSWRIGKLHTVKVGLDANIDASMATPVGEPIPDCEGYGRVCMTGSVGPRRYDAERRNCHKIRRRTFLRSLGKMGGDPEALPGLDHDSGQYWQR